MCGGASSSQKNLSASTGNFYTTLQGAYNTHFADQSNILSNLHNAWSPILNAGPNQQGFSAGELADLNSKAINSTANNYKFAAQQSNEARAARGGGNTFSPSGGDAQVDADIATKAAQQLSGEQTQIDQANYAQGRQNFEAASGALSGVAAQDNPLGFASAASNTGDQAFKMDTQINAENNSWKNDLVGGLTSIAGSWAKGGFGTGGSKPAPDTQPPSFYMGYGG
jgi:hypothetical protein